jgi:hypothetical protein
VKTIEDLREHDHQVRVNFRADAIARRHVLGLSQRDVADRIPGRTTQPVVARFEKALQWKMSTVQRWARALEAEAHFRITGLPEPWHVYNHPGHEYTCPDGPIEEIDRWLRTKAIADAIGTRFAAGPALIRVADICGCTYQTMSEWEDNAEDDTRVPVLQRYVRATGILARIPDAHLAVDLVVPAEAVPAEAVPAGTVPTPSAAERTIMA